MDVSVVCTRSVSTYCVVCFAFFFFFSSRRRHTRCSRDWSSDVCSSDLDSWGLIRAFPVFGCGLGGYESAFMRYKASLPMFNQDYAHNDYLQGLAELGIVGFAIVATLGIVALKPAIRSIRTRETMYLGLACVGAIT